MKKIFFFFVIAGLAMFSACSQDSLVGVTDEGTVLFEEYQKNKADNPLLQNARTMPDLPIIIQDNQATKETKLYFNNNLFFQATGGSTLGNEPQLPIIDCGWYDNRYFVVKTHYWENGSIYGKAQVFIIDIEGVVSEINIPYTVLGIERKNAESTSLLIYSEQGGYHSKVGKLITKINFLTLKLSTFQVP